MGEPDVWKLANSLTPEQINDWMAFDEVEGIGSGNRRLQRVLANGFAHLFNAAVGSTEVKEAHFLHLPREEQIKAETQASPRQLRAIALIAAELSQTGE